MVVGGGGGEMLQLPLHIQFDVIKRSVLGVLTIFRTVNFSSFLLAVASRACDVLLTASAASFQHFARGFVIRCRKR